MPLDPLPAAERKSARLRRPIVTWDSLLKTWVYVDAESGLDIDDGHTLERLMLRVRTVRSRLGLDARVRYPGYYEPGAVDNMLIPEASRSCREFFDDGSDDEEYG